MILPMYLESVMFLFNTDNIGNLNQITEVFDCEKLFLRIENIKCIYF